MEESKPVEIKVTRKPYPACAECGEPCNRRTSTYCSIGCSNKGNPRIKSKLPKDFTKEEFAFYQRARRYGLSTEELIDLLAENDGICVLCNEAPASVIDHCHTSLKVGGHLCQQCNSGLGFFKDRPDLLENAIIYLNTRR